MARYHCIFIHTAFASLLLRRIFSGISLQGFFLPRGKVYCELLVSTTFGANWTRLSPGNAFIPHGAAGSLDSHTTYAAARPFESPHQPGTMLFFYAGGNGPHSGPRRDYWMLATAPSTALAGYAGPGTVTTNILPPPRSQRQQRRWQILLHHSAGGSVQVAVLQPRHSSRNSTAGTRTGQETDEELLSPDRTVLHFKRQLSGQHGGEGDSGVVVSSVSWRGATDGAAAAVFGGDGRRAVRLRFEIASGTTIYAFQFV